MKQLKLFPNDSPDELPEPKQQEKQEKQYKPFDSKKVNANTMYSMCLRKRKYTSLTKAEKAAWFMTQKYGKPQRAYYCPLCHCYHLTTKVVTT